MKNCIFCGTKLTRRNRSKEHLIPRWLLDIVQSNDIEFFGKHTTFPNKPEVLLSERYQGKYSLVLGGVCKNCNNNWLSQLENNTKPILLAVLDDRSPIILTYDQFILLAKWAYKTAVTLNYAANYKNIIPLTQIHNFYLDDKIPTNVIVDLAFCNEIGFNYLIGGNKKLVTFNKKQNKNILKRSYIITLQIDHLLMRISWTPDRKYQVLPVPASFVYRLYPQNDKEITIQVIRGATFRDISQFHFVASIIAEDDVYKELPDIE